jgi:hypothetical protein
MTDLVVRKEIPGEMGVVKLEQIQIICPACGQQVEAVASDGWVRGYCAVAQHHVDFPIEKPHTTQTKAEISAGPRR